MNVGLHIVKDGLTAQIVSLCILGHHTGLADCIRPDGMSEFLNSMKQDLSVLLSRAMPVRAEKLRITGECDLVELLQSPDGVSIHGRGGVLRRTAPPETDPPDGGTAGSDGGSSRGNASPVCPRKHAEGEIYECMQKLFHLLNTITVVVPLMGHVD